MNLQAQKILTDCIKRANLDCFQIDAVSLLAEKIWDIARQPEIKRVRCYNTKCSCNYPSSTFGCVPDDDSEYAGWPEGCIERCAVAKTRE